jgi:hypothetical protein
VVGDRKTKNLVELLQLVEATTKEAKKNFLGIRVDEVISNNILRTK